MHDLHRAGAVGEELGGGHARWDAVDDDFDAAPGHGGGEVVPLVAELGVDEFGAFIGADDVDAGCGRDLEEVADGHGGAVGDLLDDLARRALFPARRGRGHGLGGAGECGGGGGGVAGVWAEGWESGAEVGGVFFGVVGEGGGGGGR